MRPRPMDAAAATIDPSEIEKFSAIADEWWDPFGKFRPLHRFNPTRLLFIKNAVCAHFGRDAGAREPLQGLRILDVGCGGGLVAEPMARLGAGVTAIDASERNIKTAMVHAADSGLEIDYRATSVEDLVAAGGAAFDVVLNLEVVEHVADVNAFLAHSAALVKPDGMMIVATINRTLKAFALAKVAAEYILGWLPRGAHDPRKFLRPDEIAASLERAGMSVKAFTGVSYNPLMDQWRTSTDTAVNYMATAVKTAQSSAP
ncbi:MAG: bifunctional 2-polyprenyl-6-hydroxyphenol methylase/3-demethylubiquinol 3-O-methyltransferase UbiG [Parvularculaceae bacterium]